MLSYLQGMHWLVSCIVFALHTCGYVSTLIVQYTQQVWITFSFINIVTKLHWNKSC